VRLLAVASSRRWDPIYFESGIAARRSSPVRAGDAAPSRPDVEKGDARSLPLERNTVNMVFMDPPYGDHIDYSNDPSCIGKLSAYQPQYFRAMHRAFKEAHRVLVPGGILGVYVCDYFEKKKGFAPVGFQLFLSLVEMFTAKDIISVVRHNKKLEQGNFRKAAEEGNFFLRGFNYLMIVEKPAERGPRTGHEGRR